MRVLWLRVRTILVPTKPVLVPFLPSGEGRERENWELTRVCRPVARTGEREPPQRGVSLEPVVICVRVSPRLAPYKFGEEKSQVVRGIIRDARMYIRVKNSVSYNIYTSTFANDKYIGAAAITTSKENILIKLPKWYGHQSFEILIIHIIGNIKNGQKNSHTYQLPKFHKINPKQQAKKIKHPKHHIPAKTT